MDQVVFEETCQGKQHLVICVCFVSVVGYRL